MSGTAPAARCHQTLSHMHKTPFVEAIARWSSRHRKTAIFGWLGLIVVAYIIGQLLGTPNLPQNDLGQAGRAEQTLENLGVAQQPAAEDVLIQARNGASQEMRQAISQVTAALDRLPTAATAIRAPVISKDGRSAVVAFTVPGPSADTTTAVGPALNAVAAVQAQHPNLTVAEAGDASVQLAINNAISSDLGKSAEIALPLTLVLLALVFGALVAAGIPVLLAITSALTAIWLLAIPGHWLPVGNDTSEVVLLIGMAVGVDYSLFFLRREREERARGVPPKDSIATAARTSGRAIVASGVTVMAAVAGLFLTGYSLFSGMAFGTIMVVAIAVTGSLTVLPAVLSVLGDRVNKGRIPFIGRRRAAAPPSRFWGGLVRRVVRHPLLWGGAALIVMLVVASPALGLRLGQPVIDAPEGLPVVTTLEAITTAFPQSPSPAEVVVTGQDLTGPAVTNAIAELKAQATATGPIREPVAAGYVAGGRGLIVNVPLAGNGGDTTSFNALQTLRDQILPQTLGRTGVSYAVGGDTASTHDDIGQMSSRTPLVLAVVAMLAFCLLLFAFRSLVLPLVSILLNLLSVGAAYGVIVWIFQDGRLRGPLGYQAFGAIVWWVPLFMFVFLFGLSMDYHVFILSRIRERWQHGDTTKDAITGGIATSAGVVTSAAIIMMAVFSIFIDAGEVELKMLGVGLPVAVLLDATIVRGILVPASLTLLGDRCWYLPTWLNWLPGKQARESAATSQVPTWDHA
jgi:RND superfamily putative drug exporter